ncbi:unnamed protein product [Zymoseptoria tritici ST99CH_3D7]|uniref:Protein root UVB sensitive/RUS domain-containing protein n=2 Tax=Zymoseptoria tritici TaxID=1047171 RepID=A0A1X7S779_ZYMT9|nr:unnamed protein product [Zymoseptoria tritici ST99CH_3D7]
MESTPIQITEYDNADNVSNVYVQSSAGGDAKGMSRVDVIPPKKGDERSYLQQGMDVFLPAGFPHSVTEDYTEYQIYDSLQAFSSSIAAMLSSRAVLSSIGVGDTKASPTAALLLSVLQESVGRLATILFAHRFGTSLEPECKMYRLMADVLNDSAFILDVLSPIFPKPIRIVILSFSSILRSLCGVAAGSSKASLSAHFARWGNLGELNAKDSSQETVISLMGMLAGSLVISWITTPLATWTALIGLLSVHLETNRRAVRAVKMRTLNRQRATLVFHHLQRQQTVPSIKEISSVEHIFEWDGVLRTSTRDIMGYCDIGTPFLRLLEAVSESQTSTKASHIQQQTLSQILSLYNSSRYILWHDRRSTKDVPRFNIILKKGAEPKDLLIAWWQALFHAQDDSAAGQDGFEEKLAALERSLSRAKEFFERYEKSLREKGWDVDNGALETASSTRVVFGES